MKQSINVTCTKDQKSVLQEISKDLIKVSLCVGSMPYLSNGSCFRAGRKILQKTGICPSALFPKGTTPFFDKYVNYPKWLTSDIRNPSCFIFKVGGPIFEELIDRVVLQEFLLKWAPKKILQKISPQYAHLPNKIVARVARVCASSIFFALHHSWDHNCKRGDMYPYLIAGVIFGTLQEISGHPVYNTITHVAANSTIFHCKI